MKVVYMSLKGLWGSEESRDYNNLSSDAYAKKYPEKFAERQAKNKKLVHARKKTNVEFLDTVNELAKNFTGSNPIADKVRETVHELATKDMRESLVADSQNRWQ